MNTCFFIGQFALPNGIELTRLKKLLSAEIKKLFNAGCETFVTSLTFLGFHFLAATEIIKLKDTGLPIKLQIVHPYINYGLGQTPNRGTRNILSEADEIIYIKKKKDCSYFFDAIDNIFIEKSDHAIVYAAHFESYVYNLTKRAEKHNIKLTFLN